MIHKDTIENYSGTMKDMVEEIGNLRYDALADFLNLLMNKIQEDGNKDKRKGRIQLASHLHACSTQLRSCKSSIDKA